MVGLDKLTRKDVDGCFEGLQAHAVYPALTLALLLSQQIAMENGSDAMMVLTDAVIGKLQALDACLSRLYQEVDTSAGPTLSSCVKAA